MLHRTYPDSILHNSNLPKRYLGRFIVPRISKDTEYSITSWLLERRIEKDHMVIYRAELRLV